MLWKRKKIATESTPTFEWVFYIGPWQELYECHCGWMPPSVHDPKPDICPKCGCRDRLDVFVGRVEMEVLKHIITGDTHRIRDMRYVRWQNCNEAIPQ